MLRAICVPTYIPAMTAQTNPIEAYDDFFLIREHFPCQRCARPTDSASCVLQDPVKRIRYWALVQEKEEGIDFE